MTQAEDQNVEIVRRGFEAMRRGDVEGLLADCDPEIEFVSLVGQVEGGDSYAGHDGMLRFFSDLREAWEIRLRNGKVAWSKIYFDREEARRESGLDR